MRPVLRGLGWLALVLVGGALFATATLETPGGRAWVARRIEGAFSDAAHGELRIGSLRSVRGLRAHATDVVFSAPSGEDVLRIDEAHVAFDPLGLLTGELHLRDARAAGVLVRISPGQDATTSLEDAFSAPRGEGPSRHALAIDTHTIRVRDATLVVAMAGPEVRASEIDGFVRVVRPAGALVSVRLDRMRGRLESGPGARVLGTPTFRADAVIRARAPAELDLRGALCLDPPMHLALALRDGVATLRHDGEHRALGAALRVASVLTSALEVERDDALEDDERPAPGC
ncbi:MAG: hypothetical protein KF901_13255 [Myxococcales bacterium]|nr:hypothetical protein [Myxococcales bacterium]